MCFILNFTLHAFDLLRKAAEYGRLALASIGH